ncbi:MAG TPA: CPBP family intramembrane glutamic endopeptidase [Thermoanaerobaculia bacterium]
MAGLNGNSNVRHARRGLAVYFFVLVPASAALEFLVLRTGEPIQSHSGLIFLLMWCPAAASVIARLALREGFRDVSFRFGGREGARALLIAWLYPLAVGFLAYGSAWATRTAAFAPPALEKLGLASAPPASRFLALLALSLTIGTVYSIVTAAGEEIGWRGYMLTRLIDARVPMPVLASGLIWGAWHLPLILSGQYASSDRPALSAALFLVDIVAFAYLAAWLRLRSGSVWPAVLIHASWNVIIQNVFDASTPGAPFWIGESGILTTAVNVLLVFLILRSHRLPARSQAREDRAAVIALES